VAASEHSVDAPVDGGVLPADVVLPPQAKGVVLFAHGSSSLSGSRPHTANG
jgi:hypothetical protein